MLSVKNTVARVLGVTPLRFCATLASVPTPY
jgi:hypothetical protein